jgi:thiol:disulfide interchange protein
MMTTSSFIHRARVALFYALGLALLALAPAAYALDIQPYTADRLAQLQSAGKPVAVHFHAEWCGTCKTQEKALQAIKAEGSMPQVTLLVADYDKEKELRRKMKVAAQSTLVVFKGGSEVTRLGGETATDKLKAALVVAARAS